MSLRIYSLQAFLDTNSTVEVRLERTLKPHSAPVITTAVDDTGTLLATGGADGLVKVWDIQGGYVTHTFRGHAGLVSALHFFELERSVSGNGGSSKDEVSDRRKTGKRKELQKGRPNGAQTAAQRGFRLASGDDDGKVRVWDLQTRRCISVLDSHVSVIRALNYSSERNVLVSASRDKTLIVWDVSSYKAKRVIPLLEGVESAGFVAGGTFIYTAGESGVVRIWNSTTAKEVTQEQEASGEGRSIVQVIYHQGANFLLAVHSNQSLLLHSTEPLNQTSGEDLLPPLPIVRRISGTHDEVVDMAYLMPDYSLLALATNLEDVRIVSVRRTEVADAAKNDPAADDNYLGADVGSLKGHQDIILCLDTDWSGQWLATGAKDNTARLWRIDPVKSNFTCFAVFSGHAESLGAVALPKNQPPMTQSNPLDHPPPFLITGSQDLTIKCWDVPRISPSTSARKGTVQSRYTRKAHDKDINALDINHNFTLFASASQDRTVKIWSVEEGEVQGILRGHRRGVWTARFAPKKAPGMSGPGESGGSRGTIVTGGGDKTVKIWSLSDYSCLRTLEGHTNSVLKVVWLPVKLPDDGGGDDSNGGGSGVDTQRSRLRIASAGGDGLVKVWDGSTGEVSCTLDNHSDRVWALAVNGSTGMLASGGGDGVITFWKDTTAATAAAAQAAAVQRVEQEQQLQNFTHAKAYREAITLALQMNHPARLLALFTAVVYTSPAEERSLSGVQAVDDVLSTLDDEQLFLLLCRIRDWNTNARTAPVAQRLLWVVVRLYPASRFVALKNHARRRRRHTHPTDFDREEDTATGSGNMRKTKNATAALEDILDALKAYTQRHYDRIDDLVHESYLIEYTLAEMDQLGDIINDDGHHHDEVDNATAAAVSLRSNDFGREAEDDKSEEDRVMVEGW